MKVYKNAPYHRTLMEFHLGRKLREDEVVHHINEDSLDNRIENLQVMTRAEHSSHHGKLRKKPTWKFDRSVGTPGERVELRVTKQVSKAIRAAAKANNRTIAGECARLLQEGLAIVKARPKPMRRTA